MNTNIDDTFKVTEDRIEGFFKDYRFLSNFHECIVTYEDLDYPSSEAAYQAAKTLDREEREQFITLTASQAKRAGRRVKLREDWEFVKRAIMLNILSNKFKQNPDLKEELIATGEKYLEETNWWKDTYWGVYNGKGENHLGKLLMLLRAHYIILPNSNETIKI